MASNTSEPPPPPAEFGLKGWSATLWQYCASFPRTSAVSFPIRLEETEARGRRTNRFLEGLPSSFENRSCRPRTLRGLTLRFLCGAQLVLNHTTEPSTLPPPDSQAASCVRTLRGLTLRFLCGAQLVLNHTTEPSTLPPPDSQAASCVSSAPRRTIEWLARSDGATRRLLQTCKVSKMLNSSAQVREKSRASPDRETNQAQEKDKEKRWAKEDGGSGRPRERPGGRAPPRVPERNRTPEWCFTPTY
ncbi:hypothetical protein H920_05374 [Fukomys damarensis]|uniref:Uncharacterized protein n=1 Tax=Fukomys damarensis TaxID=885580 RepID=A0A091ED04_FUKDA|nr:hypothetical protein H920_05374 [Fukomys damarensis]